MYLLYRDFTHTHTVESIKQTKPQIKRNLQPVHDLDQNQSTVGYRCAFCKSVLDLECGDPVLACEHPLAQVDTEKDDKNTPNNWHPAVLHSFNLSIRVIPVVNHRFQLVHHT